MKPSGTSSLDDDDAKPATARRIGAMTRTYKVYPQVEGTVFPDELLAFAVDAAREAYVLTGSMGAAFNIMKRQVKDRWAVEKTASGYVFKEHVHPLERYLRPSAPEGAPQAASTNPQTLGSNHRALD